MSTFEHSSAPPTMESGCCLVLDIGKTNVKLHLLSNSAVPVTSTSRPNEVMKGGLYPHADVNGIWRWMCEEITRLSAEHAIDSISITTHGATSALIDANASDDGLVLPVLDYEFSDYDSINEAYREHRPDFYETFSPDLPAGLNLGRQLYWQQKQFASEFSRATHILMYPQYWAWRLSGALATEVTSLGCHTDLWQPAKNDYSSLVHKMNWRALFPNLTSASQSLGCVRPELSQSLGLPEGCEVYAGVHDSNASFLRYKLRCSAEGFTVISTGTWTILMASGVSLDTLDSSRDMLANVDVSAQPVACARFMGGREFEEICAELGGSFGDKVDEGMVQNIMDKNFFALPDFSGGSGPFGWRKAEFVNASDSLMAVNGIGAACASVYCALMMDYQLDQLQAKGDIFIEGAFLQNPILCGILASLRKEQNVFLSADATGTVQGCVSLTHWQGPHAEFDVKPAPTVRLSGLDEYRKAWRDLAENRRH